MKKASTIFIICIVSVAVFLLGFKSDPTTYPHEYFEVYLDGELLGMIESEDELNEYIQKRGDDIKKTVTKYKSYLDAIEAYKKLKGEIHLTESGLDFANKILQNKEQYKISNIDVDYLTDYVDQKLYNYSEDDIKEMRDYVDVNKVYVYADQIYIPNGTKIQKIYTYETNTISVKKMYNKLISKKKFTVPGYKFSIKKPNGSDKTMTIYTTDPDIFKDAIERLIVIFLDEDKYEAYKNGTQNKIQTTGSEIKNVYIEQEMTYKAVNIPVSEKIYTSSTDLSADLLYGEKYSKKEVGVKVGDTIESISYDNKISVQEFLIFNKEYKSRDNLLVPGTNVIIANVDPKLNVIVETHEVVDKATTFTTVEQYNSSLSQGSMVVTQQGSNGVERVTQNVKYSNGNINYIDPVDKVTIKPAQPKIVNIGTKYVPRVGSTTSWGWPTNSGYTLSSYYGYRLAVFGEGNFHTGIDIAGTGYGSPVYASNNGVVVTREYSGTYGYHIMIDHNNGYYSLYAHMSRFAPGVSIGSTVKRGQTIGYVGATGWATGPHLHYEIRTCEKYSCTTNPLAYYR